MKVPVLGYHPWFLCSKWKGDDNQKSSQKTSEMSLPGSLGKVTRIVPDKEVFFIAVVWFCHATYHLTYSKGEVACCVTKKQRSWLQKLRIDFFIRTMRRKHNHDLQAQYVYLREFSVVNLFLSIRKTHCMLCCGNWRKRDTEWPFT